jgi:serine/threonine-protein kinase RsbW
VKKEAVRKKFQVLSDLAEVQKTSTRVLDFLKPLALDEPAVFDVRLCLEEALINAIKYGNRLQKNLPVDLEIEFDDGEVRIAIEDRGAGFDVKALEDCTHEKNLFKNHGRGVFLMHQLMDKIQYNDKGNRLLMVKFLKRESARS